MLSATNVCHDNSLMLRDLQGHMERVTWISDGFVDFIICHSASIVWLEFLRGPVCTHPVLLVFDMVNPQYSITAVWASAPQVIGSFPPSKEFATPVYNQVHQQQIGAEETTQNIVEIPLCK